MRRTLVLSLVLVAVSAAAVLYFRNRGPDTSVLSSSPVDIWFTADTSGRIEPCGCFTGQYGGLTRVSTTLRRAPAAALKLEIGNAIAGTEDYHILQFRHLLAAEGKVGYHALNLGSREASLPADTLRSLAKDSPVPLVSANVLDAATREPVVAPWRVVKSGGLRIGLIGVVSSAKSRADVSVFIENAADSLRRVIPEVKKEADVLVCMAFTDEAGMEKLARDFYELALILGGDVRQPSPSLLHVNQSWLLATTNQSRALAEVHLKWNAATHTPASVDGKISLMHDGIAQDPDIAAFSAAYRKAVRPADLAIDHPGASGDSIPGVAPSAVFVGSEACASCHATAFASWQKTQHSHAFDSLVRKDSDADPSCISCHVIGFTEPGGYRRSMKAERLVHVGCETCHGPASQHIKARTTTAPGELVLQKMRPVGPGQCVQCHHGEFSRPFKYDDFWPLIKHGREPR